MKENGNKIMKKSSKKKLDVLKKSETSSSKQVSKSKPSSKSKGDIELEIAVQGYGDAKSKGDLKKKKFSSKPALPTLDDLRKTTYLDQYLAIKESPLFDRIWYMNNNHDVAYNSSDPVEHFLKYGSAEGRNPSLEFDTMYYLNKYPIVTEIGINPFYHYLVKGQFENCFKNKKEEFYASHSPEQLEVFQTIEKSYYFKKEWYLSTYPDVITSGANAVVHYSLHGAFEGRNPGPEFNTLLYSIMNEDVRSSDINPLYHYVKFGSLEGRRIFPVDGSRMSYDWQVDQIRAANVFDVDWYLKNNPDLTQSGMYALEHWVRFGCKEGRNPSATFDMNFYRSHPGVSDSKLNLLIHYIHVGKELKYETQNEEALKIEGIKIIEDQAEGLFDETWYLKTYPDVKASGYSAIEHYVRFGSREGRNPSPNFFTKYYFSQLTEESEKKVNPLVHYITKGKELGLAISPGLLQIAPALPTGDFNKNTEQYKKNVGSIAVMAHIFYEDMCEDIMKYLSNIPYSFSLLVSTDNKTKKEKLEKSLKTLSNVAKLVVKVTPNRGRDIAPMFVEFGKECMKHDYVLHIHSKKSPYGSQVAGWFDYSMQHLLDSKLYVDSIFQQFIDDKELGIVYPPAFPGIATHMAWGDMLDPAKKLLDRLNVPKDVLKRFPLDFPSGSMFWFRSKALKPLFDAKMDWKDFPDEEGQKDETLAHVIERLFFYVADHKGYGRKSFRPAIKGDYFLPRISNEKEYKRVFAAVENPDVSIVIPVYNQWEYTAACLASIHDHTNTEKSTYEVIIADDGSTDETVNLEKYFQGVKIAKTSTNLGFLGNCNNAALFAKGKYILFLNNDTQVQPNWLSSLVEKMEADEKIGVIGSKLVYPDGTLQEAGGIVWQNASGMNYGRNKKPEDKEFCYFKESDYISGASILVRKSLWDKLGGFDKRYIPAYYEDTDIAFEARAAGLKVCLQPASLVVHFEGKSHGTDLGSGIKKYQVVNKEKFLDKWKTILKSDHGKDGNDLMWARERSKKGKVIAIMDYYLPEYDRHAGARHTWDYIKLLVNQGYTVKFFACVVEDERQLHFAREMEQMGIETFYPDRIFFEKNWSDWLLAHKGYYDAVIINRPHVAKMHIEACKKAKFCTLYFCHDVHSLREKREAKRHGVELKNIKEIEEYEKSIFKEVDFAYTPSVFEEDYVKKQFDVKQITYLPLYLLDKKTTSRISRPKNNDLVFVGGMRHAPNIDGIQWFLDKVWPMVLKKVPDAVINIIGSHSPDELIELNSDQIRIHGGVSEEKLMDLYMNASGVVIPLLFGAGVKGKTVEALKLGIPTISTGIGLEGIPAIKTVLKANDKEEAFAKEVIRVLKMDNDKWLASSSKLQEHADKYFSKEEGWKYLKKGIDLIKSTK